MTPADRLTAAVAEHDAALTSADQTLRQLYDVIREVALDLPQRDIADITRSSPENIRQIVNGQRQPKRHRRLPQT